MTTEAFRSTARIRRRAIYFSYHGTVQPFFVWIASAVIIVSLGLLQRPHDRSSFLCRGLVAPVPSTTRTTRRHFRPLSPVVVVVMDNTRISTTTSLFGVVMDPPSWKERRSNHNNGSNSGGGEEEEAEDSNDGDSSWTPSANGGFFANIPHPIRLLRRRKRESQEEDQSDHPLSSLTSSSRRHGKIEISNPRDQQQQRKQTPPIKRYIPQVTDLVQYKKEVVDVDDFDLVAVRFYAPWCKACRAVERPFRRLTKDFPTVKFVEVPVTKENAYLHQGLGIPSLPFAHIYQTTKKGISDGGSATLVEEMKISKRVFANFKQTLGEYASGGCQVFYDETTGCVVDSYTFNDNKSEEEEE